MKLSFFSVMKSAKGFSVDKDINLLTLTPDNVHEFKKHMPNTEMFLETATAILKDVKTEPYFGILRLDMNQFASINQQYGFEVGDKVIVACYMAIVDVMEASGRDYAIGRAVEIYASSVYSPCSHVSELRYIIDETHFTLIKAKQLGVGHVYIEEKQ